MQARLNLPETALGAVFVLGAGVIAGTGAVMAKVAYAQGFAPVPLLAVRFIVSTLALSPLALAVDPVQFRLPGRALGLLALLAGTNLAAAWFYFMALDFADASVVVPIHFTYPALVMLITRMSGEGLRLEHVGALVVGWLGLWLLSGGNVLANLRVLGFGLASAGTFAVYLVIAQAALRRVSIQASLSYIFLFMALGASALWALSGEPSHSSLNGWLAVMVLALISTVLARLVYFAGLKRIGSYQTSLLGMAEPLSVLLMAALVLGERLQPLEWLGATLVLISGGLSLRYLRPAGDRGRGHAPHG